MNRRKKAPKIAKKPALLKPIDPFLDWTFEELAERQKDVKERLLHITVRDPPKRSRDVFSKPADCHRDFMLKEMQWLAADFSSERQRHGALRRKLGLAVHAHFQAAERREERSILNAASHRKKHARRIGTRVSQWWSGVDKLVTYQQKCEADKGRAETMNQQLLRLVRQTEKYTKSLQQQHVEGNNVETVLRSTTGRRHRVRDYSSVLREISQESDAPATMSSDSDASIEDVDDDETTMKAAEMEESEHRQLKSYSVDPDELRNLKEEAALPVGVAVERLKSDDDIYEKSDDEDYHPVIGMDVDDEKTMIAEERRGRDMSYQDEIALLQNEAEMPIEKLRELYGNMADKHEDDSPGEHSHVGLRESRRETKLHVAVTLTPSNDSGQFDGFVDDPLDEDEYRLIPGMDVDDEKTMIAEEKRGRDMSYQDEIALLQNEAEMPIEKLRELYRNIVEEHRHKQPCGEDSDSCSQKLAPKHTNKPRVGPNSDWRTTNTKRKARESKEITRPLKQLKREASVETVSRPFILSTAVRLRRYQHAGLSWLVSLQSRRLNGILADGKLKTASFYSLLSVEQKWDSVKHFKPYHCWHTWPHTRESGDHI